MGTGCSPKTHPNTEGETTNPRLDVLLSAKKGEHRMFASTGSSIGARQLIDALLVRGPRTWGPWTVECLSVDSVTLRGKPTSDLTSGKAWIVLVLSESQMIRLPGRVERVESAPGECTQCFVTFQGCGPNLQDQILRAVAEQREKIERSRIPVVVALDCGQLSRTHLRRDLRLLGREVLFFSDPLDAVWFMNSSRDVFSTILVDASFVRTHGPDILPFLHEYYPDKRRLLVCREKTSLPEAQPLLWSTHGVLEVPWTQAAFEVSLGLLSAAPALPERRIIFVDDDPAALFGLQLRLRNRLKGCEVVWVTSGEVALAEFKSRPFDVVVSDLKMPGMDGLMLLTAVKQSEPKARRIVLSGCDLSPAAGVADYLLAKPCPVEKLCEAVMHVA
jgi:CheY-like chemotaxis protein